jgi:hypothetical protein
MYCTVKSCSSLLLTDEAPRKVVLKSRSGTVRTKVVGTAEMEGAAGVGGRVGGRVVGR